MKCQVHAIQWGGGVVAEFSVVSKCRHDSVGGGGGSSMEFPFMGPFYIRLSQRGGPGPPRPPPLNQPLHTPPTKYDY